MQCCTVQLCSAMLSSAVQPAKPWDSVLTLIWVKLSGPTGSSSSTVEVTDEEGLRGTHGDSGWSTPARVARPYEHGPCEIQQSATHPFEVMMPFVLMGNGLVNMPGGGMFFRSVRKASTGHCRDNSETNSM